MWKQLPHPERPTESAPNPAFPYRMIPLSFLFLLRLLCSGGFNKQRLPGNRPFLGLVIAEQSQVTVTS